MVIQIKLAILLLLSAIMLTLLACARSPEAPAPAALNVPIAEFEQQKNISREMQVAAGETFTVTLGSNQTTGFRWSESATVSDSAVLKQVKHEYVSPQAADNKLGAPGQEVWTFAALKPGTGAISMDYSRSWEGGEKGVWTFTLAVTVK